MATALSRAPNSTHARSGWCSARAVAAIPNATGPAPATAVECSRSAAAGAGDLSPPRPQHPGLHRDLPLLGALVAAFRAADANEDEDDGMALGLGVAEHAQLGARPDRNTVTVMKLRW